MPILDDAELAAFLTERNRALTELDIEWARKNAREACDRTGLPMPSDEVMLIALHKARYVCKSIEPLLRRESGKWLLNEGYKHGLLPEGELPE